MLCCSKNYDQHCATKCIGTNRLSKYFLNWHCVRCSQRGMKRGAKQTPKPNRALSMSIRVFAHFSVECFRRRRQLHLTINQLHSFTSLPFSFHHFRSRHSLFLPISPFFNFCYYYCYFLLLLLPPCSFRSSDNSTSNDFLARIANVIILNCFQLQRLIPHPHTASAI